MREETTCKREMRRDLRSAKTWIEISHDLEEGETKGLALEVALTYFGSIERWANWYVLMALGEVD